MKLQVIIDAQTYQVEIEDIHDRPVIAFVEGEKYEVCPEESLDVGVDGGEPGNRDGDVCQ